MSEREAIRRHLIAEALASFKAKLEIQRCPECRAYFVVLPFGRKRVFCKRACMFKARRRRLP